jgi:hypothetical protein
MRIATLMESHIHENRRILRESCDGLTDSQRVIVEGIYNELSPLIEASLAPQQIQQLFGEIEKAATAGGDNRTGLGLGVDVAKEANKAIDNLGKWMQDTTPVKMFDQKFEQLKGKVSTKFPALAKQLTTMGEWAKANPGKTAAIIGVLTTLASVAGGPVGGAIAGQILKGAAELMKGEKLSTAVGKGAKAAALGWLTGKAVNFIGNALTDPAIEQANEIGKGVVTANYRATIDEIGGKFGDRFGTFTTGELYGRAEDVKRIRNFWKAGVDAWKEGDYTLADEMFTNAGEYTVNLSDPTYINAIAADVDKAQLMKSAAEEMQKFFGSMATVAQGATTAATGNTKKESVYRQTRPLSEGQVYLTFKRIEQLNEGPMDWIKDKAGKAADWVGKKATNLTTVVTADKLNSAWQDAGSPTDSEELKQFLTDQGVKADIIDSVYNSLKISSGAAKEEPAAQSMYAQIKKDVQTLDKKGRQRIMAYLQKQLGTA